MKTCYPLLALGALLGSTAQAHVTLEEPQALAGAGYKAVLRVGHGCEGAATHTLSVRIPEGFRGAKPMPKAGWTLTVERSALAAPYESHGRRITEDVVQITWKAISRESFLADAYYDEFVLRGQAPAKAGPLWFGVRQQCEKGEWNWADIPATGTSTKGLKAPAVLLDVVPDHSAASGD